jgi:hypothetical protein
VKDAFALLLFPPWSVTLTLHVHVCSHSVTVKLHDGREFACFLEPADAHTLIKVRQTQ